MNRIVEAELVPALDALVDRLGAEKARFRLDGVDALDAGDKFLPGKIALGFSDALFSGGPRDARQRAQALARFREVADLTVSMDNEAWGIYYYLSALNRLRAAGLLDEAVSAPTLARLRRQLDWRSFVRTDDFTLIKLPENYYGVAFGIARLRAEMGWEDERGSERLLAKLLQHYKTYSGEFGFSDETDGDGRFDRYSILLAAEVCERAIETGLEVSPELKALLRRSAGVALEIADAEGAGFTYGRSLGPYGDTAPLEILSTAAALKLLTPQEEAHAYAYGTRIVARYADFWFDRDIGSVDMWGKGRRTDTYRARHRILGENFSLLHQLISANDVWNRLGYRDKPPAGDLAAWLDQTRAPFALTWFARGAYDRALVVVRDRGTVISLPMINGGAGQFDNGPYYPLPFARGLVAGTPDSRAAHVQLLPKFRLADGSELIATSYIKDIATDGSGPEHTVSFRQDELARVGQAGPVKDARLRVETRYRFAPGRVTRTDTYTAPAPLRVERLSLEFASFSEGAQAKDAGVSFAQGRVERFEVSGIPGCRAEPTAGRADFQSPEGPMKTLVHCEQTDFEIDRPLKVEWTLSYH